MVLRSAAKLYVTRNEPFAFRDVAAIIHQLKERNPSPTARASTYGLVFRSTVLILRMISTSRAASSRFSFSPNCGVARSGCP